MSFPGDDRGKQTGNLNTQAAWNEPPLTGQEAQILALLRLRVQGEIQSQPKGGYEHQQQPTPLPAVTQTSSPQFVGLHPAFHSLLSTTQSALASSLDTLPQPLESQGSAMAPLGAISSPMDALRNTAAMSMLGVEPRGSKWSALSCIEPLQGFSGLVGGVAGSRVREPENFLEQAIVNRQIGAGSGHLSQAQQEQQLLLSSLGTAPPLSTHGMHSLFQTPGGSDPLANLSLADLQILQQNAISQGSLLQDHFIHEEGQLSDVNMAFGQGGLEDVMLGALGKDRTKIQSEEVRTGGPSEGLSSVQGLLPRLNEGGPQKMQLRQEQGMSPVLHGLHGRAALTPGQVRDEGMDLGNIGSLLQQPSALQLQDLLLTEGSRYPAGFQALLNAAAQHNTPLGVSREMAPREPREPIESGILLGSGAIQTGTQRPATLRNPSVPEGFNRADIPLPVLREHRMSPLLRSQPDQTQSSAGKQVSFNMPSIPQEIRATLSEGAGQEARSRKGANLPLSRLRMSPSKGQSQEEDTSLLNHSPKRPRFQVSSGSGNERAMHSWPKSSQGEGIPGAPNKRGFSESSSEGKDKLQHMSCMSEGGQGTGLSEGPLSEEEKRRRKLELNKEAARRMRLRKAMRLERLEKQTLELQAANWETQKQLREATNRMERLKGQADTLEGHIVSLVQEAALSEDAVTGDQGVIQEQLVLLSEVCSPEALQNLEPFLQRL